MRRLWLISCVYNERIELRQESAGVRARGARALRSSKETARLRGGRCALDAISGVERYRRGLPWEDLGTIEASDERAIFCATQLYVDYLERLALLRYKPTTIYEMEDWELSGLRYWTPGEFEKNLRTLRDAAEGHAPLDAEERYALGSRLVEALFAPGHLEPSRMRSERLSGPIPSWTSSIPRYFWEAGTYPRREGVEAPGNPARTLAPVARWLRWAFGELVRASEAARRIGISHEGVRVGVRDGRLRALHIGGSLMIPEADVNGYGAAS